MAAQRVGGIRSLSIDGVRFLPKGSFTVNPGGEVRAAVVGADSVHGYSETPQVPFLEGVVTVTPETDVAALRAKTNATVVLELGGSRTFSLSQAWAAGEWSMTTEQGELSIRFEGLSGRFD